MVERQSTNINYSQNLSHNQRYQNVRIAKKKNVDLVFVAQKRPKIATSKWTAYSAITTIFVNETIVFNKFTVKLLQLKIHKNHHLFKFFFL